MIMKNWIHAFRLRTLPLAFSCIIVGAGMSFADGHFSLLLSILLFTTTLFLQVLSNLANDYGDFVKGTDNENRVGPERALQSGNISKPQMIKAIWIVAGLCCISGCTLIYYGTKGLNLPYVGLFVLLGALSVVAAIKYSVGKNAYGYVAMGDFAVFIFFGWLGVLGAYFLHTHCLNWMLLLPATSIGLLSVAVLNINNMRDHIEDTKSGKRTLVTIFGIEWAKKYHLLLNLLAVLAMVLYLYSSEYSLVMMFFGFVLFILPILRLLKINSPEEFDPFLKIEALSTFIYSLVFIFVLYIK